MTIKAIWIYLIFTPIINIDVKIKNRDKNNKYNF